MRQLCDKRVGWQKSQIGWWRRTLPGSLQYWQGWHRLIRLAFYTLFVPKHFSGFVNRQLFPKADRAKDFHIDSCIEFIECINRGMSCSWCDVLRHHNDLSLTLASPQSEAWIDNQRSARANLTEQWCIHEGLHGTQAKNVSPMISKLQDILKPFWNGATLQATNKM